MNYGEREKAAKTEHTPEPWSYGEDNDGWYVEKDGLQIAHGLAEEDARRIVACVNACAGVDVAWLESMSKAGGFATMNQYIAAYNQAAAAINYEKQRDELLAALDGLINDTIKVHANGWGTLGANHVRRVCESAIASVKDKA